MDDDQALREALIKIHGPNKPEDDDAGPSESKAIGFAATISYIIDGKTEGLLKATEVTLPDIYPAPSLIVAII